MATTEQIFRAAMLLVAQVFLVLKVREHGPNKGEIVETFLRSQPGGMAGQPWCVAFVAWIYETCCMLYGVKKLFDANLSCSDLYNKAEKANLIIPASQAQTGDLFLIRGGSTGWRHVVMCREPVKPNGHFRTIEGNTNDNGSAEGVGVFSLTRSANTGVFIKVWK